MTGFLARIAAQKRREITAGRDRRPLDDLARACGDLPPARGFRAALTAGSDRIIAEVKRRSPSVARFARQEPPAELARIYHRAGAAALSLVTDRANFGTGPDDIAPMRAAVPLPLIAKDFVLDPWQLHALRLAGADAVLLIARLVGAGPLRELHATARALGLDVLVECHDAADLDAALAAGADLVGFNNRDLDTFAVDLDVSRSLLPRVPRGCAAVVESGLAGRAEIEALQALGASAFLVGGSLLQADDPAAVLRALRGVESHGREEAR
jgi:indole-3-glycerol phosphate synthase